MQKTLIVFILIVTIISCELEENNDSKSQLQLYKVYNEELLAKPATIQDGFLLISLSEDTLTYLSLLDTTGYYSHILNIDNYYSDNRLSDIIMDIKIVANENSNSFILWTYEAVVDSDTLNYIKAMECSIDGTVYWENEFSLYDDSITYTFLSALVTTDNQLLTVYSKELNLESQNELSLTVNYFTDGIISETYSITDINATSAIDITIDKSDNLLLITNAATSQTGHGQDNPTTSTLFVLDRELNISNEISLSSQISSIESSLITEDTIIFACISSSETSVIALNSSFETLWETVEQSFVCCGITLLEEDKFLIIGAISQSITSVWDNLYLTGSENVLSWETVGRTTDSTNTIPNNTFNSEYYSSGIAGIVNKNNELYLLGITTSFGFYNNILFLKTTL